MIRQQELERELYCAVDVWLSVKAHGGFNWWPPFKCRREARARGEMQEAVAALVKYVRDDAYDDGFHDGQSDGWQKAMDAEHSEEDDAPKAAR